MKRPPLFRFVRQNLGCGLVLAWALLLAALFGLALFSWQAFL